jgi:hypothetical protein
MLDYEPSQPTILVNCSPATFLKALMIGIHGNNYLKLWLLNKSMASITVKMNDCM